MEKFSQKLVYLRKSKNLTQQQLAAKINYSDKVISKWERGECIPDVMALNSIAKFYDLTLDELMRSCELAKSEDRSSLKSIGMYFHILLAMLPIIFAVMFLCSFNFRIGNDVLYIM